MSGSELDRFRLDGRVAVVPGGSGGIGARLCAALAGVGARVVLIGRDERRAEEYPEAEFDRIMDLNLRSALLPAQAAARAMIAGGRGGGLTACQ